ncbi:YeeE/YedE family protein [Massilia endophytica]|uniref:YeeE/YedE family protein n=1 Tax=Massilia endophytica TaxID=2899220 RepID=UPI001E2CAB40|nr:YeeE/YedE family protein [Massilia endophytica]UGQ48773.1 YeeE/YedE family protein [Massilia endophytica]
MIIDWAAFTPWKSLIGGLLIGLGAAVFVLFNGRVAGISGIVGGLLRPARGGMAWRIAFLAGLVAAPLAYGLAGALPPVRIDADGGTLIAAGLLVGFGSRYGSGCTSGHGVCGIARLSPRSMAATAAFMLSGFGTVYVLRHMM